MIRAETSSPMSKDQYRHEANAFWELKAVVKAWSETTKFNGDELNGHEMRNYGLEVIHALKKITKKIDDAIEEGKEMKEGSTNYKKTKLIELLKEWDWDSISSNSAFTFDIIKNNHERKWNYYEVSGNKNITIKIIEENLDFRTAT